jgi:high affinity Mn2+ porin
VTSLRRALYGALVLTLAVGGDVSAQGQEPESTILTHPPERVFWVSGQINLIGQHHGAFPAPYSGDHSFRPDEEQALSRVLTIFTGVRLPHGWEMLFDVESAGGRGLSDAFGLAGFTDLDVVRNPSLGSAPYVARAMVRKVFALSDERVDVTPAALALSPSLPTRRIEIRAGRLGIVDFFDLNAVGSDSHLQFTNWTVDNNGGYDYAADTRGYTYGVIVEFDTPRYAVRGAVALMPKVANGIDLDWNIAKARGDNLEVEVRPTPRTVVRVLGYANHANMGSYDEAIRAFQDGRDPRPDIEAHRRQGRVKYGAGANVDYTSAWGVRMFARLGWNEGHHESFAYTEVNNTVSGGADLDGSRWRRRQDRIGAAVVSNGLSNLHADYLRLGGLGFLLGDGTLQYGRENIVESYYNAHVWRGIFAAAGVQYIRHPGYNEQRGPVLVESVRLHVEF